MELQSLFEMMKADRYTQDGREEIAKLQETEDVTYKTGDISQKTGLQKQPDGSWAPPKGGARKATGEKKPAGGDYNPKDIEFIAYDVIQSENDTGTELNPEDLHYEWGLKKEDAEAVYNKIQEIKKQPKPGTQSKADRNAKLYEGGIKELVQHAQKTRENWTEEELQKEYDLDKTDAKAVKEKLDRLANPQRTDNSDLYELETESEENKKSAVEPTDEEYDIFKQIVREFRKSPNKKNEQIMNEAKSFLMKKGMTPEQLGNIAREVMAEPKDAAPRQLTGDTRIKVRK